MSTPPFPQPLLAPSILAGDHGALAQAVAQVETSGCQWLHLDIMDGHFVPNITFGPGVVEALRPRSRLFFDTHLMLSHPFDYIEPFAKAGADLITVHVEADDDPAACFEKIRKLGCQVGLALNPGTPAEWVRSYLPHVNLLLAMTVQPGFGGQSFRDEVLPKIEEIRGWRDRDKLNFRIEVDGGVDRTTAPLCQAAGADTLVAGSAFFRDKDPTGFRKLIEG
jgi:ribulose-phosphate 3-epimerase